MKTSTCICLALLVSHVARCEEKMTVERFKTLIAAPGDTNALRPELASLPFWTNATCGITLTYAADGRTIKEECTQTAKTVEGRYIVFSTYSKDDKRTVYAVVEYDEAASAYRQWGVNGETLIGATMIFDHERRISASTASYSGGFMELSVGSRTPKQMFDRTSVYKDGALYMKREVRTLPATPGEKVMHNP
jgi:hypothetical protein